MKLSLVSLGVDLNLMREGQSLSTLTADIILGVTDVIHDFRPDIVLVHGDTTTAAASAIASFYVGVDVGHVEAEFAHL